MIYVYGLSRDKQCNLAMSRYINKLIIEAIEKGYKEKEINILKNVLESFTKFDLFKYGDLLSESISTLRELFDNDEKESITALSKYVESQTLEDINTLYIRYSIIRDTELLFRLSLIDKSALDVISYGLSIGLTKQDILYILNTTSISHIMTIIIDMIINKLPVSVMDDIISSSDVIMYRVLMDIYLINNDLLSPILNNPVLSYTDLSILRDVLNILPKKEIPYIFKLMKNIDLLSHIRTYLLEYNYDKDVFDYIFKKHRNNSIAILTAFMNIKNKMTIENLYRIENLTDDILMYKLPKLFNILTIKDLSIESVLEVIRKDTEDMVKNKKHINLDDYIDSIIESFILITEESYSYGYWTTLYKVKNKRIRLRCIKLGMDIDTLEMLDSVGDKFTDSTDKLSAVDTFILGWKFNLNNTQLQKLSQFNDIDKMNQYIFSILGNLYKDEEVNNLLEKHNITVI